MSHQITQRSEKVISTLLLVAAFGLSSPTSAHPQDAVAVTTSAKASVGVILAQGASGGYSGTGFIVGNGVVLTAYHVVEGADTVLVKFPAYPSVQARVTNVDKAHDLAVLITPQISARALPIGNVAQVREGQQVVVIGFPRVEALGAATSTVTVGIVSAVRPSLLRIQASVSPGNSGGPILNLRGEVIGVVRGILLGEAGINFATSIEAARPLLNTSVASSP